MTLQPGRVPAVCRKIEFFLCRAQIVGCGDKEQACGAQDAREFTYANFPFLHMLEEFDS